MTSTIWKFGNNVDTDQIVPGRYAPFMLKEGQDVHEFAFVESRPDFNKEAVAGDIMVAADNFGCGSSREYAPVALKRRGIAAIIANDFARIFFRNAVNLGIPLFVAPDVVAAVENGDSAEFNLSASTITIDGTTHHLPALPDFAREIVEAGGIVPFVRENNRFPGQA